MTFHDPNAALYRAGPLANLGQDADEGWNSLDMGQIHGLLQFVAGNCEINTVQSIVYGSLISGDIAINTADDVDKAQKDEQKAAATAPKPKPTKPGMERSNKSDAIVPLPARDEAAQRVRSRMWAEASISSMKQEDLIGFSCNSYTPNTSPENSSISTTDPMRPCVLQLDRVTRISHRVDVFGQHEFRFYQRKEGFDGTEVLIPDVYVSGPEMPNASGRLSSKIIRLMSGPYDLYNDKLVNTKRADRERANPTLVTMEDAAAAANKHDPKMISSHVSLNDKGEPIDIPYMLSAAQTAQAMAVADSVSLNNCLNSGTHPMASGTAASAAANPRKRKERHHDGFTEYEIASGRAMAANHMPEAPADMLSAKQAWLETVCLTFQIPMSMISSGDATGKAKLNAESASSDSSRVYLEAQAARKRRLECWIGAMYSHMYGEHKVREFVSKKLEESKGKEKPTLQEMNDRAVVLVNISGTIEPNQLQSLHQEGSLKYPAYVNYMARITGLSMADFHSQPLIPIEDLAGIAQPEPPEPKEGGASSSSSSKKKAKSSK